jgi:peptide deformylase
MILKILQVGDPVLRTPARPLSEDEFRNPRLPLLVEMMRLTMRDAPGVGLAAPQIGESLQQGVIEDPAPVVAALAPEERAARQRDPVPFHVLVNPVLRVVDPTPVEFFEGCLSFSPFQALVPRARAVHVDALDATGAPVAIDAEGWYARILQHEIDHLHGTLCLDHMLPRSLTTRENHERFWHGMPPAAVKRALGIGGE